MSDTSPTKRVVTLRQFCSAKGGVGKSTLAVATAKLLAKQGASAVFLLDTDHMGTSLADGLDLRAPRVTTTDDGAIDFSKPADGWWSRAETERLRIARDRADASTIEDRPPPPLFLADMLLGDELLRRPKHIRSLFWRLGEDDRHDGVHYLPASPLNLDLRLALRWLVSNNLSNWTRRFTWLIDTVLRNVPGDVDFVIDSPPGRFGLAVEVLRLQHHLTKFREYVGLPQHFPKWTASGIGEPVEVTWRTAPVIVTSSDRNDLWSVLDWWLNAREELPQLQIVANRVGQNDRPLAMVVRERLAQIDFSSAPELQTIPLIPSLASVFSKTFDLPVLDGVEAVQALLEVQS